MGEVSEEAALVVVAPHAPPGPGVVSRRAAARPGAPPIADRSVDAAALSLTLTARAAERRS
ncbi:hypothetical protein [Nonomuraea sp. NPDC003201]